jgi:hypothetical protein
VCGHECTFVAFYGTPKCVTALTSINHINQSRAARAQVPMKPGGKYNEPASVPTALVEEWATFLATQGAGSLWACPIFGLVTASSDEISRVRGARLVCVCAPPRFFCHLRRRARAVK